MKKYVFVYYGGADMENTPPEEMKVVMDKWMAWFEIFKEKTVDGGNPFGPDGTAVTSKGAEVIPKDMWPATGYTIINAQNMEEATKIASDCPILEMENGTVRVYEAMPM